MGDWYLLQFKPNSHRIAERNLIRQGFETFLPIQEITQRRGQHFIARLRPLFPGYMFVSVVRHANSPWRKINSTLGVSKLIRFGDDIRPLPKALIDGLKARCDAGGRLLPPEVIEEGQAVEMISGPFASFVATVESIDADKRVWVLLDLMGREVRVKANPENIRPT